MLYIIYQVFDTARKTHLAKQLYIIDVEFILCVYIFLK